MPKFDEMWVALALYQPYADRHGFGSKWATMCLRRTSRAAHAAWLSAATAKLHAPEAEEAKTWATFATVAAHLGASDLAIRRIKKAIDLELQVLSEAQSSERDVDDAGQHSPDKP